MQITITTESGIKVTAPTEKWLTALIVTLSDDDQERFARALDTVEASRMFPTASVQQLVVMLAAQPERFRRLLALVDTRVDAYASVPESVQRSLRS